MWTSIFLLFGLSAITQASNIASCSCGYKDGSGTSYTDAIIVYFNETQSVPDDDFQVQHFAHKVEKGWNIIYRQGALADNVAISNASTVQWLEDVDNPNSLELYVDPSTTGHLVNGGGIRSLREDILHGTFRASMRSPHPWAGGSALTMMLFRNDTSSFEIDLCNTDKAQSAAVTQLFNGESPGDGWPQRLNYSELEAGSNGGGQVSPWNFMDIQLDWSTKHINYSVAGNQSRSVKEQSSFPTEPMMLQLKHWSSGETKWTQGPPTARSAANVAYIRAFFNSSLTTEAEKRAFDEKCHASSQVCDVDDMTLRGSSNYSAKALLPWKEPSRNESWEIPSAAVSGSAASIGIILLINVLMRRVSWQKLLGSKAEPEDRMGSIMISEISTSEKDKSEVTTHSVASSIQAGRASFSERKIKHDIKGSLGGASTSATPVGGLRSPASAVTLSKDDSHELDMQLLHKKMAANKVLHSDFAGSNPVLRPRRSNMSDEWSSNANTLVSPTPRLPVYLGRGASSASLLSPGSTVRESQVYHPGISEVELAGRHKASSDPFEDERYELSDPFDDTIYELGPSGDTMEMCENTDPRMNQNPKDKKAPAVTSQEIVPAAPQDRPIETEFHNPPPKKRVDHLAGLVAFSCFCITFIHFTLTFIPFVGGLSYGIHYRSDYWARWIVSPVILDPIWLGPFFVTSCRFLADKYLQKGDLMDVAQRMLLRAPRILIPCVMVAMLQYFFIEEGFTGKLQSLSSVSWSTWPYVTAYPNFGWYLDEMLELAYLIPNKAPGVVTHYCVGVLWTVPVQLQFSYTTLLAAVMVRDIKKTWKRMLFYGFCIINNWYALSWGSCFWLGVLLADLQLTYEYHRYIMARPWVQYPLQAFLWCVVISAPLFSLLEDRLGIPIMTWERGIHPDPLTGLATSQTARAGYPQYYEPRLNTLLFAVGLQIIVETSTWAQWFLSLRAWLYVFPHTLTIYLIHGFVFWSLGAWLVVTLAQISMPYWAIMLVNWVCCYATIGIVTVFLTPLCEGTAKAASRNLWRWAHDDPVPSMATLAPFRKNLFLSRSEVGVGDEETLAHGQCEVVITKHDEHDGEKNRAESL